MAIAAPTVSPSRNLISRFIAASLTAVPRLASRTGARSRIHVLRKKRARTLLVYSPVYGLPVGKRQSRVSGETLYADAPILGGLQQHHPGSPVPFRDLCRGLGQGGAHFLAQELSLIHISEPTRLLSISYAVFCLKKKKN